MPTRRTKTTAWRAAGRLAAVVGLGLLCPLGGAWAGDPLFPTQVQSDGAERPDEARLQEQRAAAARALQAAASQGFTELEARLDPPSPEGLVLLEDWLSRYRGASVSLRAQDHPVDIREVALAEEALRDLTAALAAPAAPEQATRAAPQAETAANRADPAADPFASSELVKGLIRTRGVSSGQVADLFGELRGKAGFGAGAGASASRSGGGIGRIGGDPIILGALDKSLIDAVVKRHMNQIRDCYQRELADNPTLGGKVTIKFVVAKDGSVAKASVKSSTLENEAVTSCITGRIQRFQFPEPKGGGIVIVSYPFLFSPE